MDNLERGAVANDCSFIFLLKPESSIDPSERGTDGGGKVDFQTADLTSANRCFIWTVSLRNALDCVQWCRNGDTGREKRA